MVNKMIVVGRAVRDAEMTTTGSGTTVTKFSIATSEKYKGNESTEFINCVAFNKLAEICGQYITKGMLLYVEGRYSTNEWENDGIKRKSVDCILREMKMLSSNSSNNAQDSGDIPF